MNNYIEPILKLINGFSKLPSVGSRTALKYAYRIISMTEEEVEELARDIVDAKRRIKYCSVCGNFTDVDPCHICSSRQSSVICVVKEPKDVIAIERTHDYNGLYHVLHGTLNPMEGIGPNDIKINELLGRLSSGDIEEIILATNPDVEGEATAMYISKLIKPLGIKVSRIARGIPLGSELEYTDEVTLSRAIADRKEL